MFHLYSSGVELLSEFRYPVQVAGKVEAVFEVGLIVNRLLTRSAVH